MADFRAERSATPEGEGRAKAALEAAWSSYYGANRSVNEVLFAVFPPLKAAMKGYTSSHLFDLFGFWVVWRLTGGFEGMQAALGLSRSAMYRRIALFREAFGEHPDVYEFPGVTVDPVEFARVMKERQDNE